MILYLCRLATVDGTARCGREVPTQHLLFLVRKLHAGGGFGVDDVNGVARRRQRSRRHRTPETPAGAPRGVKGDACAFASLVSSVSAANPAFNAKSPVPDGEDSIMSFQPEGV